MILAANKITNISEKKKSKCYESITYYHQKSLRFLNEFAFWWQQYLYTFKIYVWDILLFI